MLATLFRAPVSLERRAQLADVAPIGGHHRAEHALDPWLGEHESLVGMDPIHGLFEVEGGYQRIPNRR